MSFLDRVHQNLKSVGIVPYGTQFKDLVLPIFILTITIGVSWTTFRAYESQKESSILIDIAGRQRMLSQRLYLELIAGHDPEVQVPETLRYLEESAKALRFGGKVRNPRLGDNWESIGKTPPSLRIATKLDEQIAAIEALTLLFTKRIKISDSYELINNISLIAYDTVQLYIEESQLGVVKVLVQNIVFIIVLASLGLGLNRLIIDRKYQMKELAKAKETAIHASEAKSIFLANMSHEIRTPLNAVIGMAELLEDIDLNVEHTRYVKTLKRASDTLMNLINGILDLSRVESGQLDLMLSAFELTELVDQVSQIIALKTHQKGLELICYVSNDVPKAIFADRNRLLQILMNLLSNAVKFTKSGEISLKIELDQTLTTLAKDPNEIVLNFLISDTGIGIAKDKLDSIFEAFVQADSTVSFNYGGTGLGLAISKELVALMGGQMGVDSTFGYGSTFTFSIKTTSVNKPVVDPVANDPLPLQGQRILVVDDNDTNRMIIRKYLSNQSCLIDEAHSGNEALSLLRKAKAENWNYDLILLDYRMPYMSGFEVAKVIRDEQLGNSAIIGLLTSDGAQDELAKLPSLGILDYLIKPIRRSDFSNLIQKAIGRTTSKSPTADIKATKTTSSILKISHAGPDKKYKVLVVDDMADNRFVVTSYLGHEYFEIDEAGGGQEALALVHSGYYDLIFMDIRMTPMDGYEATSEIRKWEIQNKLPRRIPIVALTAHALKEEMEKTIRKGFDYHLTKPITKSQLYEMVEKILNVRISDSPAAPIAIVEPQDFNQTVGSPTLVTDLIFIETESFLKPRVAQYVENRKNEVTTIRTALTKHDYETIVTLGHNVSGTAGIYGMMGLGELARKVESAAIQADGARISILVKDLESYLSRVRIQT